MLDDLISYHSTIAADPSYIAVLAILRSPWIKKWFWIRGGNSKLNPLEFTSNSFLDKTPRFENDKAKLFDRYIDSIIERRIRYDSSGHIEEFKKLLKAKGTGVSEFTILDEVNKRTQENETAMKALKQTSEFINILRFPIDKEGKFKNFLAFSTEKDFKDEADPDIETAIHTSEKKAIVTFNVPANKTIYIKETDNEIKDKSAFQQSLGEVLDSTISLSDFIKTATTAFNPVFNTLNPVLPKVFKAIAEPTVPEMNLIQHNNAVTLDAPFITPKVNVRVEPENRSFLELTETALRAAGIYQSDVFSAAVAINPAFTTGRDIHSFAPANLTNLYITFIDTYKKEYEKISKNALDSMREDSLVVSQFVEIFSKSTLPVREIKADEPDKNRSKYYTDIQETRPSSIAIEKKVQLFLVREKDSAEVTQFSYKVGKTYKFQVSAGLVYTIPRIQQSEVRIESGQVKITTNNQQFRMVLGLHTYFGKGLFLQDNHFSIKLPRWSVFTGVGIPKPLDNFYLGAGVDLVPGLKLVTGAHFYKYTKYTFRNDQLLDKVNTYKLAGPFVSLNIDPPSFLKAIGLFK